MLISGVFEICFQPARPYFWGHTSRDALSPLAQSTTPFLSLSGSAHNLDCEFMCAYVHVGVHTHVYTCLRRSNDNTRNHPLLHFWLYSLSEDISIRYRAYQYVQSCQASLVWGSSVSALQEQNYRKDTISTHHLHVFWGTQTLVFTSLAQTSTLTIELSPQPKD